LNTNIAADRSSQCNLLVNVMSPRFLFILLNCLNFVLICYALGSVLLEEYLRGHLQQSTVDLSDIYNQFLIVLFLLQLFDVHLIFLHFCGFRVLKCVYRDFYTVHLALLLRIWVFFASEALLFNVVKIFFVENLRLTIYEATKTSLLNTIEIYDFDLSWTIFWNDLQFRGLCCGVNDYLDWGNVIWQHRPMEKRNVLPTSCYKKEHFPATNLTLFDYTEIGNTSTINLDGCLAAYFRHTKTGFDVLTAFNISLTFLQTVIVLGMRLLFLENRDYR
jgi:hypothetical protein